MRLDLYEQGGYAGGGITENGGNITGPLLLAGNPSQTLEAVPKQYVDAYASSLSAGNFTSGTLDAARLPSLSGDVSSPAGSAVFTLKNSGVTPGSYGKVIVNSKGIVTGGGNLIDSDIPFGINWSKINSNTLPSTLAGYGILDGASSSGSSFSGSLKTTATPTLAGHAVNKQYVDSLVSSGGIAVGDILRKPVVTTPSGFLRCNGGEVDKTTYADLYAVIGDSFDSNTTPGSGKPWQNQYQINSTQSGDIIWTTDSSSLPVGTYYSQAIVTKNRVYLLGGWNGAYTSAVYTAPINADGTLGAWAAGTALPAVVSLSQALITKNRVYLISGYADNGVRIATVLTAAINSDGTLGNWVYSTNLPIAMGWGSAFITKNRMYLCGGVNNSNAQLSSVYTAPISSDGTIGDWSLTDPLPLQMAGHNTFVTKKRVYVLGGYSAGGTNICTAAINSDGTLGAWSITTSLPAQAGATSVYLTKYRVYVIGGYNGSAYTNVVYSAPINADGTLGVFVTGSPLPGTLGTSVVIATKNRIYTLGGQNSAGSNIATIYSATINGGLNDYSPYYTEDTTNYLMSGSGLPWKQQYQINETQSSNITSWSTAGSLPVALASSSAIVTKNRVYMIGGNTSSNVSTSAVYTSIINSDGTLGTWTAVASLPGTLAYSSCVITKNRVYLCGGSVNGSNVPTVYTAPINSDGTLGTWASSTSLPIASSVGLIFITKNRVYLLPGNSVNIYTAAINSDGTLGNWSTNSVFPTTLAQAGLIVTKNRVYIAGGNTASSTVYTATINSDGGLGPWSVTASLPGALGYSQSLVFKNRAYLLGGYSGANNVSTVYTAPINSDGTLGTWTTGTSIPGVLNQSQVIVVKNRVYLLGGDTNNNAAYTAVIYSGVVTSDLNDYSAYYDITLTGVDNTNYMMPGSGKPWQNQYQINTTQSGDITGWTTGTSFPVPMAYSSIIATKNNVYMLGGYNGTSYISTIYSAPINTDGTLGSWTTNGSVPVALGWTQAFVTKNRVYFTGGYNGSVYSGGVYSAPINSDGTLGTWVTEANLPTSFAFAQVAVTKNRVYLIGGYDGSAWSATVYTAIINSDGTLGTWSTATSLPGALSTSQVVVTNNRIYVIGGYNGTAHTTTVYTARINTDGTLSQWSNAASLPAIHSHTQAFVTKTRIYLLGCWNGTVHTNTVYHAPINLDGTIGTWVTGTSLPGPLSHSNLVVTKNRVYLIGGWNATVVTSVVYTASVLEGLNDYSPYYDGTITPNNFVPAINSKFLLPDYSNEEPFGSYSYIKY